MKHSRKSVERKAHAVPKIKFEQQQLTSFAGLVLLQPFLAAMMVFAGGLRGAGDTLTPMLINGAGVWLLRVPLSLVVTQVLGWGLTGVWMVMALDMTVRGSILMWQFKGGRWKSVQV